jgi:predicted dehydrogenase
MNDEIKIGIIGVFRGMSFARNAKVSGLKLVAVCDKSEEKLNEADIGDDVTRYADYDDLLKHDIDAVILANYYHEHAPLAIKALKKGKHVLTETMCNFTVAEGVELCEAVEDTGLIYMLAENYPYTKFNQELHRIYQSGELGKVVYAEGEYNHPMSPEEWKIYLPGPDHWRAWLPRGYYSTHAIAPLMYITDLMPKSVVAMDAGDNGHGYAALIKMEEGAVFRIMGGGISGHSNFYRIHGTRGAAEITRGPGYFGPEQVRVWHDPWDVPENTPTERVYVPSWPYHAEAASKAGHGGGDYWVDYHFAEAIRKNEQPFLDVYRGVAMSTACIMFHRSMQEGGKPFEIPDFKNKSKREIYKKDTLRLGPK